MEPRLHTYCLVALLLSFQRPQQRKQATGIALGPGIGGFLYQALGFTGPFLLWASIALVASLLAMFMVPETLPQHARAQVRTQKAMRRSKKKEATYGIRELQEKKN